MQKLFVVWFIQKGFLPLKKKDLGCLELSIFQLTAELCLRIQLLLHHCQIHQLLVIYNDTKENPELFFFFNYGDHIIIGRGVRERYV